MTTIRQAHKKNYVSISNALAQNNSLSLKARGLMLYLLSLPNDWKICINHLAKYMVEGRSAILSGFTELKKAGYVWHQKEGYKEGWTYWLFEEPIDDEKFKEFLRTKRKPIISETHQMDDPHLQSTKENIEQYKELNKHKEEEAPDGPPCVSFGKFVKLKDEEYLNLSNEHTKPLIDAVIEEINDYLASTGKKPYKDYAATIRNWIRRRKESPQKYPAPPPSQIDRTPRDGQGNPIITGKEGLF